MSNPWEYINSINFGKKSVMQGTENDELAEKGYVSYITNRALSYFPDTILYAQEMNQAHHLDNKLQYDYLFTAIPKRKRFSKWHKKEKDADVQTIAEHYKVSIRRAEEMCRVISDEERKKVVFHITNIGGS